MTPVFTIELGKGIVGSFAPDPGQPGRYLWSVRFPAHECYMTRDPKMSDETPDRWHCKVGEQFGSKAPQSFRSGVANGTEQTARDAIDEALRLGRPTRDTTDRQFVKA
jgi:hypothetical protein